MNDLSKRTEPQLFTELRDTRVPAKADQEAGPGGPQPGRGQGHRSPHGLGPHLSLPRGRRLRSVEVGAGELPTEFAVTAERDGSGVVKLQTPR